MPEKTRIWIKELIAQELQAPSRLDFISVNANTSYCQPVACQLSEIRDVVWISRSGYQPSIPRNEGSQSSSFVALIVLHFMLPSLEFDSLLTSHSADYTATSPASSAERHRATRPILVGVEGRLSEHLSALVRRGVTGKSEISCLFPSQVGRLVEVF